MTNQDKIQNFFRLFKEKYPNYKIIEFKNLTSTILIEDANGFLHKKCNASRALNFVFGIQSAVNKKDFIIHKMKEKNIDLELIEYNGIKEKCIVKDKNGFTYSPTMYDLLAGHPVTIQTCNEKEKLFIFKANTLHKFLYTYSDFIYKNGKQKIEIICKKHSKFYQTCESHLHGSGCKKCKNEISSFSKSTWIENNTGKICTFYVLRFYNEEESFLKVGVTSKNVNNRYKNLKNYKYEKLIEINADSETISGIETRVLKKYKSHKYTPKFKFEGSTECFELIVKEKLYEQFKK